MGRADGAKKVDILLNSCNFEVTMELSIDRLIMGMNA
jgi:hypothetical protein